MGKRILAIDDDPDILEIYSLLLDEEGYEVLTLLSPDNLPGALMSFNPDLILLDIQLGQHNGLEICKRLKRKSFSYSIPVIMVSAHESITRAISDFGADDIVLKPFKYDDLLLKINDFLSAKVISLHRSRIS